MLTHALAALIFGMAPENHCSSPIEFWYLPTDGESYSKAWNRAMAGGDGLSPIRTDDDEAGCEIVFGPGEYVFTETITISRSMVIRGHGKRNTTLRFRGVSGPTVCYRDACGQNHPDGYGSETVIRDLRIAYTTLGQDNGEHGVLLEARTHVERVHVENFPGHCVRIDADVTRTPATVANLSSLRDVRVTGCGGDGLHLKGGDANETVLSNVDASSNSGWGFNDESFLGTTGSGVHASNNGLGCVRAVGDSQRGRWQVYCENGQSVTVDAPNLLINPRGVLSATSPALQPDTSRLKLSLFETGSNAAFRGGDSDSAVAFSFVDKALDLSGVFKFKHITSGGLSNTWSLLYKGSNSLSGFGVTDKNHFRGAGMTTLKRGALFGGIRVFTSASQPAPDNNKYKTGDLCIDSDATSWSGWRYDASGGGSWIAF